MLPFPGAPYPTIDREMLIELDPEVIIQLLPEASPQVRESAARVWQSLPGLRAVREGRVHVIDDPWALNPTQHIGELAERFADALNAARGSNVPASAPVTTPAAFLPFPVLRERVGVRIRALDVVLRGTFAAPNPHGVLSRSAARGETALAARSRAVP